MHRYFKTTSSILIFFLITTFAYCQGNNFLKKRIFQGEGVHFTVCDQVKDLQKIFFSDPQIALMRPSKFADAVFMKHNGDFHRYFLEDSRKRLSIVTMPNFKFVQTELPSEYPLGLIVGQSANHIFYISHKDKGAGYCQININDGSYKITNFKGLKVFAIAEIPNDATHILVCGLRRVNGNNKLGFYKVNMEDTSMVEEKYVLPLKHSPRNDIDTYSGTFHPFGDQIFFNFDLRSGIFEFDNDGNFVREIKTVDTFTFKKEDETIDCTKPTFGYQELLKKGEELLVRTNLVNAQKRYLVFDRYNLSRGTYQESIKLFFEALPHDYKYQRVFGTFTDTKGNYHMLMSTGSGFDNGRCYEIQMLSDRY